MGNVVTSVSNRRSKSTLQSLVDTSQLRFQASRRSLQGQQGVVLPGL